GPDVDAAAGLRVGRPLDVRADGARRTGVDRGPRDGAARSHRADELLRRGARRELVPVREPLLVLRAPGGVHPRSARLRDRPRDPAGLRAQAVVGVPPRGWRPARRHAALVLRVAAPPVRERHQRRPAALLHALDGAHLDPDGPHIPLRDDDPVAWPHPVFGADALLPRLVLQLPHRRPVGCLPLRHAERHDDAWQLLLDGALPLHDHGRARVHVLRRHLLLGAEDDGPPAERDAREDPFLDDVRVLQPHVLPALHRGIPGAAAPRRHVPARPSVPQRLGLGVGVPARMLDAALPLQLREVARVRPRAGARRSVGLEVDRVAASVAGAGAELRPHPGVLERSVRLRRKPPGRRSGGRAGRDELMTELAQHGSDYSIVEAEEPDVLARNLFAAGHLLASATAFFFLAFLFAYFYLRSVNNGGLWKPKHVDASVTWGTIVMACIVASAMLVRLGRIDQAAGRREMFRLKGLAGGVLGLAALVLQAVGWTQQG